MARNQSSIADGLNFTNLSLENIEENNKSLSNSNDSINSSQPNNTVESSNIVNSVQSDIPVELVKPIIPIQPITNKITRKIGIELTEENYWYLKDAAYANRMQMKEYLNMLLEADRNAKK